MFNETSYTEAMKNCHKWNNKNIIARLGSNSGVLDQQTCIEQKPTDHLYKSRLDRLPTRHPLQAYSYPTKRYKRSKDISTEALEFNHFRQSYPEINNAINVYTAPPPETFVEGLEQSSMPLRSSNNGMRTTGYVNVLCNLSLALLISGCL